MKTKKNRPKSDHESLPEMHRTPAKTIFAGIVYQKARKPLENTRENTLRDV